MHNVQKWPNTSKIWLCKYRKIFRAYLVIFQFFSFMKGLSSETGANSEKRQKRWFGRVDQRVKTKHSLREKCLSVELSAKYFPHSNRLKKFTLSISVFQSKYWKRWTRQSSHLTIFTQCLISGDNLNSTKHSTGLWVPPSLRGSRLRWNQKCKTQWLTPD